MVRSHQDELCCQGHPKHFPAPAVPPIPKKTTPIKSTEDLIKEFPNRLQDIGQFPDEYTIRLCDNVQPIIQIPQNCPILMHPKVKAELDKMVKLRASLLLMNQQAGSHQSG